MKLKFLFGRLWRLTMSPRMEWENIVNASPADDVASAFVYPLASVCGCAVLIGGLVRNGLTNGGWWISLSQACITAFGLLACFWLTAWAANGVRMRYLQLESDMPACLTLTGYSMGVYMALVMFTGLFPELAVFRYVLQFYTAYVVWQGADLVTEVDEERRMTFALIVTALLLFIPFLFGFIFNRLSAIVV